MAARPPRVPKPKPPLRVPDLLAPGLPRVPAWLGAAPRAWVGPAPVVPGLASEARVHPDPLLIPGGPGSQHGFSAPACPWLSSTHLGKRCECDSWAATSRPGGEHGVPLTPEADTGFPGERNQPTQGPLLLARHTDPPSFSSLPRPPSFLPSLATSIRASLTWQPTTPPSPSSWELHRLSDSRRPQRPE